MPARRKSAPAQYGDAAAAAVVFFQPIVMAGNYDSLTGTDRNRNRVERLRYSDEARAHAKALCGWLSEVTLPHNAPWSLDATKRPSLEERYIRFALAFELDAMRPNLLSVRPITRCDAEFHIDSEVITEFVALGERVTDAERSYLSHLFLCAIWHAVSPYRIFETDEDTLASIDDRLNHLARLIEYLERRWTEDVPGRRSPPLFGVRALLALEQGRIARAIGGPQLVHAQERLTRALRIYEERISARASRPVPPNTSPEAHGADIALNLQFSAYRSGQALLQLAYLDVLRASCTSAEQRLRTASMLALTTSDHILLTEIRLVRLTARRLQQRDPGDSADATRHLAELRSELNEIDELEAERGRPAYAQMARYQRALTYLYRSTASGKQMPAHPFSLASDLAPEHGATRGAIPTAFWQVSRHLLEARIRITAWRWAHDRDRLSEAMTSVRNAEAIIGADVSHGSKKTGHLLNLADDCRLYSAWIALLERRYDRAADLLDKLPDSPVTDGYTTLPARNVLIALLRIAIELGQHRWSAAQRMLAGFERNHKTTLEVGWLLDLYDEIRADEQAQRIVRGVTDDMVRAEFSGLLKSPSLELPVRQCSVPALHDQLYRWLYQLTEQIVNEHHGTTGEAVSVTELERLWDLKRARIKTVQDRLSFPVRDPGSRHGNRADAPKQAEK